MTSEVSGPVRATAGRNRIRSILVFAIIGALIGASVGLVAAGSRDPTFRAEAVISLAPTGQIFEARDAQTEDITALVQGELIILSGPVLQREIDRRVEDSRGVEYSAAQVGSSTIVNVTSTSSTRSGASSSLAAVLEVYAEDRERRLQTEISRAAEVVDNELSRLERALAAGPIGEDALQQEYGRLLSTRSGLFRAAANVDRAVVVVQPPTASGAGIGARSLALLGALVGAVLGALLLPVLRLAKGGLAGGSDLVDVGVPVLEPEIVRQARSVEHFAGHDAHAGALRMVLSQLVRPQPQGMLVLFGASRGAGTSYVAAASACSLSERSEVLLVLVSDVVAGHDGAAALALGVGGAVRGCTTLPETPLTSDDVLASATDSAVPGVAVLTRGPGEADVSLLRRLGSQELVDACAATGRSVVFDAPVLADSSVTVSLATAAGGAALVVGHGASSRADVAAANEVFVRQGVPLLGVIRNRPVRAPSTGRSARLVQPWRRRASRGVGVPDGLAHVRRSPAPAAKAASYTTATKDATARSRTALEEPELEADQLRRPAGRGSVS